MKNSIIIVVSILVIISIVGIAMYFTRDKSFGDNNSENSTSNISNTENLLSEITNTSIPNTTIEPKVTEPPKETDVATFSTNLKGDSARLNNISITCNTINGTTIAPGESFSFNKIVGQPSADKGYQEADVFVNKKTEKGYGGGNCQVSTTIYNAALQVEGISITERHPHQKKVTYIEEGKDAAVSYSSGLDMKFQNNTGKTLKVYVSSDEDSVDARITES